MNNKQLWRYNTLGILFGILGAVILWQLVNIQLFPEAPIFDDARERFAGEYHMIYPPRGNIYDIWGNLLAGNETVYEVGVELQYVDSPETIAFTTMAVLGLDYQTVLDAASIPFSENAIYVVLARFVPADKVRQLEAIKEEMNATADPDDENAPTLYGLVFKPHLMRSYPEGDLASNLIGFVNHEGLGYFGIEEYYNDRMAGTSRQIWVPMDPNRVDKLPEIASAASLILTIDRDIQASVESILDDAIREHGAVSGTIVVMDPKTGAILAMSSIPRMDLNQFDEFDDIFPDGKPFNRAVSQAYEPGSVYKVLTMAAALDSGTVTPETQFYDPGIFWFGGIPIRNWDGIGHDTQDMQGCLQLSLNVCLAWIASEMGPTLFYEYMTRFGIGHLTGIDLASETAGRLKIPGDADWYLADLVTNSFGQGVAVTPIQMLAAISAVANQGKMVVPYVVSSVVDGGYQYNTPLQYAGMPITAETARILSEMLARSLQNESSKSLVDGYCLAGKTGTAEIPVEGGYLPELTNASFVGWGPLADPQFMVYVWLEKPTSSRWGSVVAAPVFHDVVSRLVVLMEIPPDGGCLELSE